MNPPMEIKAVVENISDGPAQDILLVLVRDTDDVCRKVELPVVPVPGLKKIFFKCSCSTKR